MTLGASDFLCFGSAGFFATGLREITFLATFLGAAFFGATFFLTALFFVALALVEIFAFAGFRATTFFATARFAFGRTVLLPDARLFAVALGEERRATAREVERLKLLVAALICEGYE